MNAANASFEVSDHESLPVAPLVSVYMLAYKHEDFISDAIAGVIAQRRDFAIELIIGEDQSPDRTREIVLAHQRQYPGLIRVLMSDANVGARANAKRCQAAARGQYIAICEGDDYWTNPGKLALQVDILERRPDAVLACHAVNLVDAGTGENRGIQRPAGSSRLLTSREVIAQGGYFIPTCSILARRRVFADRPAWWEDCPVGDYPLALRAVHLGSIAYVDQVMAAYRINVPGSWTVNRRCSDSLENRIGHAKAMEQMLLGFVAEAGDEYLDVVRPVIRTYLYNAILRGSGTNDSKRRLLREMKSSLSRTDILVARLALATGRKFTGLRALPARIINGIHYIANEFRSSGSI